MSPLRPERLRNGQVYKMGFGHHPNYFRLRQAQNHKSAAAGTAVAFQTIQVVNGRSDIAQQRNSYVMSQRRQLLALHEESKEEQIWREESKNQAFARAYQDNETDMEEEKKLVVARPKESLPFGMKIREAAHKAAFGGSKRGILQRYATFFQRKKSKEGAAGQANDIDELLNDDDLSDSVSVSSSGCSESVSLSSIDLDADDLGAVTSTADLKVQQKKQLLKMKSKKRLSIRQPKPDPVEDRWFTGPVRNANTTFTGQFNSNLGFGGK